MVVKWLQEGDRRVVEGGRLKGVAEVFRALQRIEQFCRGLQRDLEG